MTAWAAGLIGLVLIAATSPPGPNAAGPPSATPSPRAAAVDREGAMAIARKTLAGLKRNVELVVVEEKTLEKEFGWVFFSTTRRQAESGEVAAVIPGLGPLVVHRADGTTRFLPTSVPPDRAIAEYERQWLRRRRRN
jgi:immunity protein 35 of polymorphic toxin system